MAQRFNTAVLGLSKQLVTATGNNLYVNGLLVGSGVYSTIDALTQTGQALYGDIIGLSGNLIATGGLLSAVKVTGSSIIPVANFTGLGGIQVFASGGYVVVSGLTPFSSVTSLNGLTNAVNVIGTGGLTVTTQGQNVVVSGDQSISGVLTNASGALNTTIALTGSNLYNVLTGLSGQANLNFATITNLALTGSNLYITLTGMSGQFNVNLASTGSQSWNAANNNGLNLSGNLTLTGQTLYQLITSLSGLDDAFFVHKTGNETITGNKAFINTVSIGATGATGTSSYSLYIENSTPKIFLYSTGPDSSQRGWVVQTRTSPTTGIQIAPADDAGTAITQGWNIDRNGNIGIGINNPSDRLTVSGGNLRVNGGAVFLNSGIFFAASSSPSGGISLGGGEVLLYRFSSQSWAFDTNGANLQQNWRANGTDYGTVTNNGNDFRLSASRGALVFRTNGVALAGALGADQNASFYSGLWFQTTGDFITLSGAVSLAQLNQVSGALNTFLASTGFQAWNAANNNAINLSGNLTTTGQTLYNDIVNASGQANINYAPALANYLYQTGFRAPVRYIGTANYTLVSGDFILIATGSTANVTGILPSPTAFSGNTFFLINNCTIPFQLSGIIGPDTNPLLSQYDTLKIYATSGTWNYLKQTGNLNLVNAIVSLSGWSASVTNLASTGQQAWTAADANGRNLSGNLTTTGQTLYQLITNLSGLNDVFFVHRTGAELISGNKTFIIAQSGIRFDNPTSTRPYIEIAGSGTTGYWGAAGSNYFHVNYQTGQAESIFWVSKNNNGGQQGNGDGTYILIRAYSGDGTVGDPRPYDAFLGYNTGLDYGYIDIVHENVAYRPLVLLPFNQSNVGVGHTNPQARLHVSGEIRTENNLSGKNLLLTPADGSNAVRISNPSAATKTYISEKSNSEAIWSNNVDITDTLDNANKSAWKVSLASSDSLDAFTLQAMTSGAGTWSSARDVFHIKNDGSYYQTNNKDALQYAGNYSWTIPASGITGNGVWLCIWSGGGGATNNFRAKVQTFAPKYNNSANTVELWGTAVPYQANSSNTLLAMPQASYANNPSNIILAKVLQHDSSQISNSLWVQMATVGSGASGESITVYYSDSNNLTGVYSTYVEPTDSQNVPKIYFNQGLNEALKLSKGITIGNNNHIYSIVSGVIIVGGNSFENLKIDNILNGTISGALRDNAILMWDALPDSRFGIVKKFGAYTKLAYGSTATFAIARADTANLGTGSNYTDVLSIDSNGNIYSGSVSTANNFPNLFYPRNSNPSGYISSAPTGLYTGATINFDFRSNLLVPSGNSSPFFQFSQLFAAAPFVLAQLSNNSGNATLSYYTSGITTSGFNVVFSTAPTNNNYSISYLATTGTGFTMLGGSIATPRHAYVFVTGNFTFTNGVERYLWSGSATGLSGIPSNWATGTLPDPSTLSGIDFTVKNVQSGILLTLSGVIDFSQNFVLGSMQSLTVGSNGSSWLIL